MLGMTSASMSTFGVADTDHGFVNSKRVVAGFGKTDDGMDVVVVTVVV